MTGFLVSGFVDPGQARRAMRRLRLRRALIEAEALIPALLDRLGEVRQSPGDGTVAHMERRIALATRDIERGIGGEAIDSIEGRDVREEQLLEGTELFLDYLDALFKGLRHGLFAPAGARDPSRAGAIPHPLKSGAE